MFGNSFSNNGNSAYGFAGPMPEPVPSVAPLPLVAALRAPVPHGAAWLR
jgi:hypothetical protein